MPAPDRIIAQPLSPHEREALPALALRKTPVGMGVSESSVKQYVGRIGGKPGAVERAAMRVDHGCRHGQLDVPELRDYEVHLPDEQWLLLEGLANGKTVEQIAADERRPPADVRRDARRILRAMGASPAPQAVTRSGQLGLLGRHGAVVSRDLAAVAGQG